MVKFAEAAALARQGDRTMPSSVLGGRLRFGVFTLDPARGCLQTDDRQVELRPKSFSVLCHLMENAGRLVPRDELVDAIWPNISVGDDALTHCISELRSALGDQKVSAHQTNGTEKNLPSDPGSSSPSPHEGCRSR
jgi:DNA-binding response OmpR family regulator